MGTINIAELNKAEILAGLYNRSRPLGMGVLSFEPTPMTKEQAQILLDEGQTYFDYVKGRVLKVNLEGDTMETRLYNRDNGEGSAEAVIAGITGLA